MTDREPAAHHVPAATGAGHFDLDEQVYHRCARLFDRARHLLGVRITMHHARDQLEQGDVFLFNHFARGETFIPQYCIYQATGALCRSIAAPEFFRGNDRFARLLRDVGAVPSDHPDLLRLLAVDILRGRKIVIFPEGGMVKDRKAVDAQGAYHVYSRAARLRRKHHSGAARLALGLQIFRRAVLQRLRQSERRHLERWADRLGLPSADLLIERAARPGGIVPCNITFYPLRVQDNFLRRGAELVFGELSPRAMEELIVEGNLFFKATDMDIRLGDPIVPGDGQAWWERAVGYYLARGLPDLDAVFRPEYLEATALRRLAARGLKTSVDQLRDRYMREIYREVTVNLSHLTARTILDEVERGGTSLAIPQLALRVYVGLKALQRHSHVHLHRSLADPDAYGALLGGESRELREFLQSAAHTGLVELAGDELTLREKLTREHAFDAVRLENPLEVYANEAAPVREVATAAADAARETTGGIAPATLAALRFDDELRLLQRDRAAYSEPRHAAINAHESATADPAPYLLLPPRRRRIGVLLAHGFLASPAEMRPLADKLEAAGHTVLGVRLRGHGTSPWDLRDRSWHDWLASVRRGYEVLCGYADEICVIGFSTGGALAVALAATGPAGLAGIAMAATPISFRNGNMRFIPLVHGANQLVEWVGSQEGVLPFRPTDTEHPHINYRHMPIRGLYELTRMVRHVKKVLPDVGCPALVVQGTEDWVVAPASAEYLHTRLGSAHKRLVWVESKRHGIVCDDIGGTHDALLEFVGRLEAGSGGG